jgi:hypothetical protein
VNWALINKLTFPDQIDISTADSALQLLLVPPEKLAGPAKLPHGIFLSYLNCVKHFWRETVIKVVARLAQ